MRIDATLISYYTNSINHDGVFIEYRIHLTFIVSFCQRKSAGPPLDTGALFMRQHSQKISNNQH